MAVTVPSTRTRIGTTSFVFSAGWLENVRRLAGRVDDVEILLFERVSDWGGQVRLGPPSPPARSEAGSSACPCARMTSGPSPGEIAEIAALGRAHGLTFSVHAPLDLALASEDRAAREAGVEAALRTAALVAPLEPHALVLHLDGPTGRAARADVLAWQARATSSLRALLDGGLAPASLCVENLGPTLGPAEPLVEELGLSVALDVGHLARDGAPFDALLSRHLGRTRVIHWHGTEPGGRDHRSLRHYPAAAAVRLLRELERAEWSGVLTIEVFREDDLEESLRVLEGWRRKALAAEAGGAVSGGGARAGTGAGAGAMNAEEG